MASNDQIRRLAMMTALRGPAPMNTAPTGGGGGMVGQGMGGFNADSGTGNQVAQQGQQSSNPISPQSANNLMKYANTLRYGGGATQAAGQAAMPAMSAGGGSSLGSMGLQQGAVSFPGAASVGGGGGGTASSAVGGGMSGALGAAGGLLGLAGAAHLVDKEMNESKNSPVSTDKLNSLSYKGIGLRGGDLVNGFNPAVWASDPKKAAKGLANAFTFGIADKIF